MKAEKKTPEDDLMKTYQIFSEGIPRGTASLLAAKLQKSSDLIRRWQREPLSSDNEYANGKMNPLDRFLICFEHFLIHNPAAAEMVIQLLRDLRDQFNAEQGRTRTVKELFADMVREVGEFIAAAGTDASPEEIEREGAEAIAEIERMITECKRPLRQVG